MNMMKKGPELKLPKLKVPDFLLDLYYDLKDRHLLPLVAILLVALVALPIVLSKSSGSEEAEEAAAVATPSTVTQASSLVVAKATPGLREYSRRLDGRTARDPFAQKLSGAGEASGESSGGASGEAEVVGETEVPGESGGATGSPEGSPGSEGSPTPPSEGGSGSEPPEGGHLQYYSYAIDVRITPVSSKKKEQSTVRHNLPGMTMLPSSNVPALTFVGVTKDEKNAVMLVSDKVTGLFGDAACVEGSERCQLLALEPGIPETVVYGANARTYRVTLLKLRLLKTDKLNTAPVGNSKKKQEKSGTGKEQNLGRGEFGVKATTAEVG